MIDLTNRIIILTGASSEVGSAVARQLVCAGATVVLGYHKRIEVIERLMNDMEHMKGLAVPHAVDVSSRLAVDAMAAEVLARFGRVDMLIHTAHNNIDRHPFLQRTWEEYEAQLGVLLKGAFNCCQAVLEDMVLRREGRILFLLNTLMHRPVPGYSSYTTAVSALRGFARDLANEVGEVGITVNAICPGFTVTGETPHAPEWVRESLARQTPLRRLAVPDDIARAVLFFASDLAGFVTGESLTVDGGFTFGYGRPPE
ncbi:MAG: SDR family oxidoreductase [Nitrospirae bacterium]|nr:SDR family oxidoreductase [Nitrospirota bacterium]